MTTNVPVGLSTLVGYLAAAAAALTPVIGELADDLEPLGVSPQVWVVVSAVLTVITTLGRMWQAANAAKAPAVVVPANVEIDAIPVNAHEGEVI